MYTSTLPGKNGATSVLHKLTVREIVINPSVSIVADICSIFFYFGITLLLSTVMGPKRLSYEGIACAMAQPNQGVSIVCVARDIIVFHKTVQHLKNSAAVFPSGMVPEGKFGTSRKKMMSRTDSKSF